MTKSSKIIIALMLSLLSGCIKRAELIAVIPDGSAVMVTMIEAEKGDINNGDAMPSAASGWKTSTRVETDSDGKETVHLSAWQEVAAGESFPESYAPAGSELGELGLRFETSVRIERRSDGVYYHFRRVYHGRPWAQMEQYRKKYMETDRIKEILQRDVEELADSERRELATALLSLQSEQAAVLFSEAAEEMADVLSQDARVAAWRAVLGVYEDPELVLRMVDLMKEADFGPSLEDMGKDVHTHVVAAIRKTLKEQDVSGAAIEHLLAELARAEDRFKITQDITDEVWDVIVDLPGEIIAHNSRQNRTASKVTEDELGPPEDTPELEEAVAKLRPYVKEPGFEQIAWSFEGDELMDRDVVLMATSIVRHE